MATIKDVAKIANVSIATVSRVFSKSSYVSSDSKNKVIEAAEKLNYAPNFTARSLKSNRSNLIGLIISSFNNNFYNIIARQVEELLKAQGYRIIITFSKEDAKTEKECINVLVSSRVDGLIYTPAGLDNKTIKDLSNTYDIAVLQAYRNAEDDLDSLLIDDELGAYLATKKLLENGHRRILLIDYDVPIPTNRSNGYIKAFNDFNLEADSNYICKVNFNSDYNEIIKKGFREYKPTAIITSGTQLGIEVLNYCQENNLSIPNDISLVIYDDSEFAKFLNITVIAHNYLEISKTLTEMIINRITKKTTPFQKKLLNPYLIERKSVLNLNSKIS
jgi:DNA-binding LacI/PurR family transcriptional regulator